MAANLNKPQFWKKDIIPSIDNLQFVHRILEGLNTLCPDSLLGEGRVYGDGLHKLEPKELGHVDAQPIVDVIPEYGPRE